MSATRILSVASECVPLVKTGGLADVAGALPEALAPAGIEMATLLPAYPAVKDALGKARKLAKWDDLFGGPAQILAGQLGETALYALDAPHLFERAGTLYLGPDGRDWPDNAERFAALSQAAARIATEGLDGWVPEVLHLHDWQAALTPVYLRLSGAAESTGTLLTIHNIAFQGIAPAAMLDRLQLPRTYFTPEGFEFYGKISALKAGLVFSDAISTVSPTYAAELMTPDFGMGLDGVLRQRRDDLTGILNGIDTELWAPPYKTPRGKSRHKKALRKKMGLPAADGPLCVVVSRLTQQKGLDMLLQAVPALLDHGGQLAVLGSGETSLETAYLKAADAHPNMAVEIGYNEELARALITGADAILVPSRFEPCGLTQLYGLRFGTLPLVALTGGLADTVIPANTAGRRAGVATGFQFQPISADGLARALSELIAAYRRPEQWEQMQRNAMRHPVGWDASAQSYANLLTSLVKSPA